MLKKPFFLGSLQLASNLFAAPLAGCSDVPFRKMLLKIKRPGLMYCEMVKMDALVRKHPGTFKLLDYTPDMHPIGAQLCGSKVELAAESAKIVEDLGFDVIDLNCGCPVDKVTKDGSGSGLLKNPDKIGEILHQLVKTVKVPVTVKIRAGWDQDQIVAAEIVKIAEQAGAKAICIHGRTRQQGYSGLANRDWIKEAKAAASSILVIGNGDIFNAEDALDMFQKTSCDAILVARGNFGNPWIFQEIEEAFEGTNPEIKEDPKLIEMLLRHIDEIFAYQNEIKGLLDLRRVGPWYVKNFPGSRSLREEISKAGSLQEIREKIESLK